MIGSTGKTEFRIGEAGPELVKNAAIQVIDDGPGKPSSIHQHVGQRPIMAAGNTDGDLAMLQWAAASPHRTLQLVIRHTRLFTDARWSGDAVGLALADLVVARLVSPGAALTLAVDDTLFKRSGKKVFGVGWHNG